jgi:dTDP-4-dehydrorhamnose reductase
MSEATNRMTVTTRRRVLVLGATGMLGNAVLRYFATRGVHAVGGTVRSPGSALRLPEQLRELLISGVDVESFDSIAKAFAAFRPEVVINCIGLIKQLSEVEDPLIALPINSLLPHRLARLCAVAGARLIHISTDCVFSGRKGNYLETDPSDAEDLYGRSKYLGEVDYPNAITLRTSIIGHELGTAHGLVEWFLAQRQGVKGYTKAIFSGLPTVELARVIHDFVLPDPALRGVYHVSANAIDKCSLLRLVADAYGKSVTITPDAAVMIDRSLDSSRFRAATGYVAPQWPELVAAMRNFG